MKRWIALLCVIALLLCTLALVACEGDEDNPDTEQTEGDTSGGETPGGGTPAGTDDKKGEKDPFVSDNFQ